MEDLTVKTFTCEILQSDQICVVLFSARWCKPCVGMKKRLEDLEVTAPENIKFGYIDVDTNVLLAQKYSILNLPQVLIFDKGKIEHRIKGLVDAVAIENLILNQ